MSKKIALVTGSSRGIGRDIVSFLASSGYIVIINYRKSEEEANELCSELRKQGSECLVMQCDVGQPDQVAKLATSIAEKFSKLDLLVNNAGIIKRPGSWDEISNDDLLETVRTNLLGPMYTIKELVPLLKKSGSANIINISSTYGYNGAAAVLAYTVSKSGVMTLTKAMAVELAKYNIRVNAIAPGNIDTEMTRSSGQGVIDWVVSTTPLRRLGQPSEISQCVKYIIEAEFVTGHIFDIDGGQILNI